MKEEKKKDFEKRFIEENHQGLLYMIDPDIENPEETAKAHLEIIAKHWLRPNLAKEKQKLGEEIMKLATEPMWDKNQDASGAAVILAKNIFQVYGTATLPPKEGFWFDSYNSEETLKGTVNLIYNKGITPFVKNRTFEQIYIRLFGSELYKQIEEIDKFFLSKYKRVFFKSLEEASEMSQIIDDLNN